tara:strand:- start:2396 stop:2905 length:510 start_codon:yes stop_codon:yes gene_type:complete
MSKPKKGKRFVYSLKTLLNVRNIREKQQQEKFNAAEKKLHEERLEEIKMKKEQSEHLSYVNELLSSSELPSMTTIGMHQEHVKRMEKRVKEQQGVVKKSEEKRDAEQKELIQKVKEKKIIEKDKEKTRGKWKKMMDKLDSEFMDELASIKFAAKMIADESDKQKSEKEE